MLTSKWLLGHAKPKRHRRKIWLIIIINGDQCHKLCCHMQKIAHTTHWTTIWVSLSFTLPPALVLSLFVSYSRISNRIMSHATLASKSFLTYLPAPLPVAHSSVAQFVIPLCHWLSLSVSPSLYLFLTQRVLILLEFSLDYVHMDSKTAAAMCLCLVPTCCSSLVFLGYNRLLI